MGGQFRADRLRRVDDLAWRLGAGPALRRARDRLEGGDLLDVSDAMAVALQAQDDGRARAGQQGCAPTTCPGGRERRDGSRRGRDSPHGYAGGRTISSRRSTVARCDFAATAGRSPIPTPSARGTSAGVLMSLPAVTSAGARISLSTSLRSGVTNGIDR